MHLTQFGLYMLISQSPTQKKLFLFTAWFINNHLYTDKMETLKESGSIFFFFFYKTLQGFQYIDT